MLLHTVWAPGDVLLAGRQVHVVDWYLWALWLMEVGHTAASAVERVCEVPSWRDGDAAVIRAFGAAVARERQRL